MKLNYSTEALTERQRPEYWNEVVCKHCVLADSTIESPRKFIGKYAAKSIDDIEISRMSSPRHVWEREATHMRKDSNEAFLLTLMESGSAICRSPAVSRRSTMATSRCTMQSAGSPMT